MREQLIKLIIRRLAAGKDVIAADFAAEKGVQTRFTAIDDLLPIDIASQFSAVFPPVGQMRLLDSFREKKFTSKALDKFDPLITDITFAFQDERVVELIAEITGIEDAVGDPQLYAGGISAMDRGHFLNPHLDNSHDSDQENYRVLNLLYYVSPGWKPEYGGNLELWDVDVTTPFEIPSLFNRLVLMATNDKSYHSVSKVKVDSVRYCISNYYFSPRSPNGYETSHVTYFRARPEQKFRRLVTRIDSDLRKAVRKVKRSGFGKKDVYEGPAK